MKKIGFVIPWFGLEIPGGAEAELRGLTKHMKAAGIDLEILSTCVKEFTSDWNENYHKPGETIENDIIVRRFKVKERNAELFHSVNIKLMRGQLPLTRQEEAVFIEEMINSPALYDYIRKNAEEYSIFVFIPYMFGTTYYGIQSCPEKSVLIPCFHEESYVYLDIFKKLFPKIAGMIFHAQPEAELASRIYDLGQVQHAVLGEGVDTGISYDKARFRQKYHIEEPFILYAGRKDVGKNIYELIYHFAEYKLRNRNNLKLVLIGGGNVLIPPEIKEDVIDLGFVDLQDKFDAYAAAHLLCQPSKNESFSLVLMESWLCERPALVHAECSVTKHFVKDAGAGLYYGSYFEFEGAVNYLLKNKAISEQMGIAGREYVRKNFAWDVIVQKYASFFKMLAGEK